MFDWLSAVWLSMMDWLSTTFDRAVDALLGGLEGLGNWFSSTFGSFFTSITDFLSSLFQPVIWIFDGLLYLIEKVIDLAATLVKVILLLIQVLFSAINGLVATFQIFALWDPASSSTTQSVFSRGIGLVLDKLNPAGFDIVAQVLAVAVWIVSLTAVVRIVSGGRRTA